MHSIISFQSWHLPMCHLMSYMKRTAGKMKSFIRGLRLAIDP